MTLTAIQKRRLIVRGIIVVPILAIAITIIYAVVSLTHALVSPDNPSDVGSGSSASVGSNAPASGPPQFSIPPSQQSFIAIVSAAQSQSHNATNDLQRSTARANRDKALCSLLTSRQVSGWAGTVKSVGMAGGGTGTLEITVAPDITIKTFNNSFSDSYDGANTLIKPGSPIFNTAAAMKEGDQVSFSGIFLPNKESSYCLQEISMTLQGGLESPDFVFRFTDLWPYGAAHQEPPPAPPDADSSTSTQTDDTSGNGNTASSSSPVPEDAFVDAFVLANYAYYRDRFTQDQIAHMGRTAYRAANGDMFALAGEEHTRRALNFIDCTLRMNKSGVQGDQATQACLNQ